MNEKYNLESVNWQSKYNNLCKYESLLEFDSVDLKFYTDELLPVIILLSDPLSSDLVIALCVTLYSVIDTMTIPVCEAVSSILVV
jgi:hypothetical protein